MSSKGFKKTIIGVLIILILGACDFVSIVSFEAKTDRAALTTVSETSQETGNTTTEMFETTAHTEPEALDTHKGELLRVGEVSLKIGQTESALVDVFGVPQRTNKTLSEYIRYVYHLDDGLLFASIYKDEVVGLFICSESFEYEGITSRSTKEEALAALEFADTSGKIDERLKIIRAATQDYKISAYYDDLESGCVEAISVVVHGFGITDHSEEAMEAYALELFDLTNVFRQRHGLPMLQWSNEATESAFLHSADMVENNFFSHTGSDGSNVAKRMDKIGIMYQYAGENLAGGYEDAAGAAFGLYNSEGHRSNILFEEYTYVGISVVYSEKTEYKIYCTQNFFSTWQ